MSSPLRCDAASGGRWVLAFLVLGYVILAVSSSWWNSPTYDEPYHLGAGVSHLKHGDYRHAADHPPLGQSLAALCALPFIPEERLRPEALAPPVGVDAYAYGRHILFGEQKDWTDSNRDVSWRILHAARVPNILLGAAAIVLLFSIGRRLVSSNGALLSAALLAFSPDWIAHGATVSTDMPAAAGFLAVLWCAPKTFTERKRVWRWVCGMGTGICLSALFLCKFSALLVVPAILTVVVLHVLSGEGGLRGRRSLQAAGWCCSWCLISFLLIWGAYGFRYRAAVHPVETPFLLARQYGSTDLAFERMLAPEGERPTLLRTPVLLAKRHHLLPEAFLFGLAETSYNTRRRSAYLCGEYYERGKAAFFPVAFAVKTPHATQILLLLGLLALIARRLRRAAEAGSADQEARLIAIGGSTFVAVYLLTSIQASINIGHRHLLPVLPWLWVVAGAAADLAAPAMRVLRAVLVCALIVSDARCFPHFLSYFNELAGGYQRGGRFLADSSLDWGQDLERLSTLMKERSFGCVHLSRFGTSPPECFGVDYLSLPSMQPLVDREQTEPWTAGIYAISETQFRSVYLPAGQERNWSPDSWKLWLGLHARSREGTLSVAESGLYSMLSFGRLLIELRTSSREPDVRAGASILVFEIDSKEIVELRQRTLHKGRVSKNDR